MEKEMVNVRRVKTEGDAKADLRLPEKLAKDLKKDRTSATALRLDFIDRTTRGFQQDQVTKVTIVKQGGETLTLEKEQKEGQSIPTWKVVTGPNSPVRQGDVGKISQMLMVLGTVRADR